MGEGEEHNNLGKVSGIGGGDPGWAQAVQQEDGWGDGARVDAIWWEDSGGDGRECSRSGKVGVMGGGDSSRA